MFASIHQLNYVLVLVLYILAPAVRSVSEDATCIDACSDWSVTLGHCRGTYGNQPQYTNYTFANDFVQCLCEGWDGLGQATLGNTTLLTSAGICQSCSTSPVRIQTDLSTLLVLCAIQVENGTAAGAMEFRPVAYTTSQDAIARPGAIGQSQSGGTRSLAIERIVGVVMSAALMGGLISYTA